MADDSGSDLLLVYGTLKRGQANHQQLAGSPFLGETRLDQLVLHDLGPYDLGPFPMAVPGDGHLIGELYRVDRERWPALDHFEGVPRLYRRWRWLSSEGHWLWVYLGLPRQVRHARRLEQGVWSGISRPGRQDGRADAPSPQDS